MAKKIERKCPRCNVISLFRTDQKTCGCKPQKIEQTNTTWSISLPRTNIHTLEELVKYCEIDLEVWEVERFIANKWEMGYRTDDGQANTIPLFQVKAFLRKKQHIEDALKEIQYLKEAAKKEAKVPISIKPNITSGNMLEINIPDLHVGKLAWAVETGWENYDTKIARDLFRKALYTLINRVKGYEFEQIVFVVGNDLINSDNPEGTTTSGTMVSNDVRFHKTFGVVRDLMIESIESLRKIAKVKVIMVSGNHDKLSVWHLGDSLECYFHKYPDVNIENSPIERKYHKFGNVMLMFTHGHKGKRVDYPLLMATEQPEMFGQTKFREAHTGHLHKTQTEEQHGVKVRVLPALTAADAWLSENTFVGNLRTAEAYIWNKKEGLIGTFYYTKPEIKGQLYKKVGSQIGEE